MRSLCCRLFLASLCLPGLFLGSLPAWTAPDTKAPLPVAAPGVPFVGLRVAPANGITPLASNAAGFPFGVRSLPGPGSVQAVFTLTNETCRPVTVDRLQPTCRCTDAQVLPPATQLPMMLLPGGSLNVRVTVRLAGHAPGTLTKSVYVFAAGRSDPAARLDISGTLTPPSAP